jgi:hypothetical protein
MSSCRVEVVLPLAFCQERSAICEPNAKALKIKSWLIPFTRHKRKPECLFVFHHQYFLRASVCLALNIGKIKARTCCSSRKIDPSNHNKTKMAILIFPARSQQISKNIFG